MYPNQPTISRRLPFLRRFLFSIVAVLATGASSTIVMGQTFKQLPPPGIEVDSQTMRKLRDRVDSLTGRLRSLSDNDPTASQWAPDVEVLVRSVELALQQNGFYRKNDPDIASQLLDEADRRLQAVSDGKRGLELLGYQNGAIDRPQFLVGGFRSEIDDSVQPYGIVLPAGFVIDRDHKHRLDVWLHGRGDTKTELAFLDERMKKPGQYTPSETVVLHPFGRHCNAFKFAGEVDVYEAIDHVKKLIPIDPQRKSIRGFSMGGAGCWHLAVHNPGNWFATNPGAGFVDTIVYQGWSRSMPFELTGNRQRLMKWYDVLPWVANLSNTRNVAYSGEVDKQRQAADRVIAEAAKKGIQIEYVVGAGMGHKIDSQSARDVDRLLEAWAEESKPAPRRELDFVTYTLRYSKLDWLQITGLLQHWSEGRVRAKIVSDRKIEISTSGVDRVKIDFRETPWPDVAGDVEILIDRQSLKVQDWDDAAGIQVELQRQSSPDNPQWDVVKQGNSELRKRPGLQGPIDDAFCDRFLFVAPSRPSRHGVIQRWIEREFQYAKDRWRRLMRGDVRVVVDKDLTPEDIESNHLICFGDFSSNQYLREIASKLPIQWTSDELQVGSQQFGVGVHAVALCFPNPRNPDKYVVVNSGMTFREFSNVSNSRQIAMLPDWAVLRVDNAEDDGIFAGRVIADGFFDERWQLQPHQLARP